MRFAAAKQNSLATVCRLRRGQAPGLSASPEPVDLVPWKIYEVRRLENSVKKLLQGLHLFVI